jgi:hypothetical protein
MSVDIQSYPIICENCQSDNTDCSINSGSDHTIPYTWDEGWKCRDCGARFEVARLWSYEDYVYHISEMLHDIADGLASNECITNWDDLDRMAESIVKMFMEEG